MHNACEWETYFADIDGRVASIGVDMSAARELADLDAPNLLKVQYVLRQADEDGLPTLGEEEIIADLRDELINWIGALNGRCVGEVSGNGLHSWFFYVPCGWNEVATLLHRIALRKQVALGAEMMADAMHRVYHEALLPTAEELRRTRNIEQLADMAALGDDASRERPVEHTVLMDNSVQAHAFAEWARRNGFMVSSLLPPPNGEGLHQIIFRRNMPLHAELLDSDTHLIAEEAQRLGGIYDGWRAEVRLAKSA